MITRFVRTVGLWTGRVLLWSAALLAAAMVCAALLFQFWFLPRANDYRDDIAAAVQRATGVRIEIGALAGEWRNWRPHVTLGQVQVRDAQGRDALFIDSIYSEIAWKSLVLLEMRLHALDVSRLSLEVRRDAQGQMFIAGLPLDPQGQPRAGLGDWLLRQDAIRLQESKVRWVDEASGAPPLELTGVLLELKNRFGLHHVRLQATPPIALSAPLRVDAELRGEALSDPSAWDGNVTVSMPYVNLGEVRRYWPRMGPLEQGAGRVDARFEFEQGNVRQVNARLALANLSARLAPELEILQLTRVSGGIDLVRDEGQLDVTLKDLSYTTTDGKSQTGVTGRFERSVTHAGLLQTDITFSAIDLAPVVSVASRLPLSQPLRVRLQALQPQGRLTQLKLGTREQAGRLSGYQLSAGFASLAMKATEGFPGFSGMSGTVKATERGGDLSLTGRSGQINLPRIFIEPLPIDQLTARLSWQTRGEATDIRIEQFDIANRDAAGKLSGTYRYVRGTPGHADLSASLTRAEASAVWRYTPLVVPAQVRDWLRHALLAGRADQANLVVRGNLADFPFSHGRPGLFEVKVRAQGGIVNYVTGWPRLEDVACQLALRGNRLEITQGTGRIFGTVLRNASVTVPDLNPADPLAQIRGEAQGRSSDFLRYLNESPLEKAAGAAAKQIQVQGDGKLVLSLEIPLKRPETTKADGVFSPAANRMTLPWELGTLEQVTGNLRINEHGISARGMGAQFLGGPVRFDLTPMTGGGMEVVASGRASGAGIGQFTRLGWERYLGGATDWRGRFGLHADRVDALVESGLNGLTSQLPAPLGKAANDTLPLRVERSRHVSGMGLMRVQLGEQVLVRYLSPLDHWFEIKTGELVFNGRSGDSERDGLRVSGRLPMLDMDAWSDVLRQHGRTGATAGGRIPGGATRGGSTPGGAPSGGTALSGATARAAGGTGAWSPPPLILRALQVDRLRWFSREFEGLSVSGRHAANVTQLAIDGKTLQGDLIWRDQGSGQLTARLARLHLPPAQGNGATIVERISAETLPAIDAEVQDFRLGEREFGKLVLGAVPQGRVWNLRQLNLTAPEGSAQLRGLYDLRGRVPRMNVEVRVDVSDIGGYFARLRLPQGIKRGKAHLEGNLEWSGAPYSLDLPSLTGRVLLDARQGQFTQIDPGMGKLLGVLSLQSLPRRLTLDFRDIFSKGFAFNLITATSDISGGVATTQDFKMVGPAAAVELKGGADLLRETQNLRVKVIPGVSDSLTVAGAIVNPAIGLATYLAQKVFNDPVNKLFSTEYEVTGSWADPQVSKRNVEPPVSKARR